jgi:flavin reductase (DIM6/NTAB) family NADH-FMN oxidoreductase RutF
MNDIHSFLAKDGYGLPHDPLNAIIGPRPIGWISSKSRDGSVNLAPYSFFNAFNYKPAIIGFSSVTPKDTLRNVKETGEFVWNLVSFDLIQKMNQTSEALPHGVDEFEHAGLEKADSLLVAPPRVKSSLVSFECKLTQIVPLVSAGGGETPGTLVLGEVVAGHIQKSLLKDGVFQTFSADIVLRAGGPEAYARISPETEYKLKRPNQGR